MLLGYRWAQILYFGGLKMQLLAGRVTISSSVHYFLSKPFFAFWRHENAIPQGS
jgi:hypothetical protein